MINKIIRGFVLLFLCLLLSSQVAFANVEVFSKFDTFLKINSDDTVEVNKSLSLRNVYDVGIVPGQIEFKLAQGLESTTPIEILEVRAEDEFGNEVKSRIRRDSENTVIILDVFYPLLPGFQYSFNLYYKFKYNPGGIFFNSLQVPIRESTIPINDGVFKVEIPSSYTFTFHSDEGFSNIEDNTARWDVKDNLPRVVYFEYSRIPLNLGFMRGSYFFWILINLILLVFLVFEIKKGIKRVREQYERE